jgi:hypothetical protein
MNRQGSMRIAAKTLFRMTQLVMVVCGIALGWAQSVAAQQLLENPQPDSFQGGISTISGWVCNAQRVYIIIDGNIRVDTVYGSVRRDTLDECDDTNNGFSVLVNWNELREGVHTVALCVDDVCQRSIQVAVNSYGVSFLRGLSAAIAICTNRLSPAFPTPTVLTWQESSQNWAIGLTPTCGEVDRDCSPPPSGEAAQRLCAALVECCRL